MMDDGLKFLYMSGKNVRADH